MDDLRIGVIGSGGRGGLAAHAHEPGEGSRVVACCDTNPRAFERNRERYGQTIFTTADYRELLDEPLDAVFVTTPDFLHEEHAVAALQVKLPVFLEKPMAITTAGCDRILRTARENETKLYLGHNMRHFQGILKMKELIDAGAIGEVKTAWCRHFVAYGGDAYFKDWHAERTKSTGLLLQKGAHDIDVMHWLCGGYTRQVTAMGDLMLYDRITDRHPESQRGDATFRRENWPPMSQKQLNPVIDVEDVSMMLMRLDNGVLASYQQCHFTPDAWRNYTFIGTAGRIENFSGADPHIRLWDKRVGGYDGFTRVDIPTAAGGHEGGDPRVVAEFVRFVREGGKTNTSPIAARNSVAAGCAATESLRNGSKPVEVPPPATDLLEWFENQ